MKPAALLLQDLLRAHSIFLLHHDSSLSAMFARLRRSKFATILGRYWDLFLSTWSVLLHGNPVRSVFNGIKIAACGELGIGVGEEERGSGEREVLEGFVGRIEGLVDLVVAKFGPYDPDADGPSSPGTESSTSDPTDKWLGTGKEPSGEDGAIFLGVGALSRHSVRAITYWTEDLYTWGEEAYGVGESPISTRHARRQKKQVPAVPAVDDIVPMLPPPPITGLSRKPKHTPPTTGGRSGPRLASNRTSVSPRGGEVSSIRPSGAESEGGRLDKYVNYFKLGYGTHWTLGGSAVAHSGPSSPAPNEGRGRRVTNLDDSAGHYLIGLVGDLEESDSDPDDSTHQEDRNTRTLLRTLTLELEDRGDARSEPRIMQDPGNPGGGLEQPAIVGEEGTATATSNNASDSQGCDKTEQLRVVVYVNRPFIFTFLFRLRTDSLDWNTIYKSLHHQLYPLRKPLANSTSYRPGRPDAGPAVASIYDLIWDPRTLTVHSTIPNIPGPSSELKPGEQLVWSRVEAINTHIQILNTYTTTRADLSELERTCKTSRGWWIVWNRVVERETRTSVDSNLQKKSPSEPSEEGNETDRIQDHTVGKEIILIRKASDHGGYSVRGVSASYVSGGSWADGASRLAQGIGVDTKKYIESLLSLNR